MHTHISQKSAQTRNREKILILCASGASLDNIAKRVRKSQDSVLRIIFYAEQTQNFHNPFRQIPIMTKSAIRQKARSIKQEIMQIAESATSYVEIAQSVGVSKSTVAKVLKNKNFLKQANKRKIADQKDAVITSYNTLITSIGYHPGAGVIKKHNVNLFKRIVRLYGSMAKFRKFLGVKSFVYSRESGPRKVPTLPFCRSYAEQISRADLMILIDGSASLHELAEFLGCTHGSAKSLLTVYHLQRAFYRQTKTKTGDGSKSYVPTKKALVTARRMSRTIQKLKTKLRSKAEARRNLPKKVFLKNFVQDAYQKALSIKEIVSTTGASISYVRTIIRDCKAA
jgi:hypothetical protein